MSRLRASETGTGASSPPVTLAALARQAWTLEPPWPFQRRSILRSEAALQVDGLLARVARGRGALDVAMGEGLAALAEGDRVLRLGYSGIGDYARERLGMAGRTAQAMARLARELELRPGLRQAVRRGEVSPRKAQAVLPLAVGADEAQWVERARTATVRALEAAARAGASGGAGGGGAPGGGAPDGEAPGSGEPGTGKPGDEEAWEHVSIPVSPEARGQVEEAMALAGRLLGAAAPRWQRLEAICQEFVGAHPEPVADDEAEEETGPGGDWLGGEPFYGGAVGDEVLASGELGQPVGQWLDSVKAALEEETDRWAALGVVETVEAPRGLSGDEQRHPRRLDGELRRLAAMRDRWDELVGHLAMLLRSLGLWRDMGFASFAHYCAERLGMAARTVEQRAWLEGRLHELPALRRAMRDGRLSYEKARVVAGCADEDSVEAWIERAGRATCIALRREVEAASDPQTCAPGDFTLRVPRRVGTLLAAAFGAARRVAGRWLDPGECLVRVAAHFLETWGAALGGRSTPQRRAVERDGGLCQVPGCSRAAAHAHHVLFRSAGGTDDGDNLVGLCAAHHLHGVHRGWVRVHGRAPDGLVWELGERPAVA